MDNKKILLVNLSKGRTGDLNSKLLGMIFVMKFQAAAMSRANIPEDQRVDFTLYVDEFQNFATDSFATILSEARKYKFSLAVGNQFTTQLTEEIRDAVFGNIGTIVAFRVGTNDAEFLAKYFAPTFDINDLQRVPNYNAIVRMLIHGVPTQAFSMATLPTLGTPNKELGDALKQLSYAKFGRPRAQVDADITERLKVDIKPASADNSPGFNMPQQVPKPPSLLDGWLAKKGSVNSPQITTQVNALPTSPQGINTFQQPNPVTSQYGLGVTNKPPVSVVQQQDTTLPVLPSPPINNSSPQAIDRFSNKSSTNTRDGYMSGFAQRSIANRRDEDGTVVNRSTAITDEDQENTISLH